MLVEGVSNIPCGMLHIGILRSHKAVKNAEIKHLSALFAVLPTTLCYAVAATATEVCLPHLKMTFIVDQCNEYTASLSDKRLLGRLSSDSSFDIV